MPDMEPVPFQDFREWHGRSYPIELATLRAERIRRLRGLMVDQELDAMVLTSAGAVADRALVRFAANYSTTGRQTCAIVTSAGRVTLLVTYSAHLAWARQTSWADDVQLVKSIPVAIATILAEVLPSGTVGLAVSGLLSQAIVVAVSERLPEVVLKPMVQEAADMQVAKTPLELDLVRETGRIANIGLAAVEVLANVGTEERAVMATAEAAVRAAGAEATTILIGSNATVAGPLAVARPLRAGDTLQVSVELAGPGGYWVQAVRTLPIGSISPSVENAIEASQDLEARLAAYLVAGNPVAGLDRIAETISLDGLEPAVPIWHGVGLGMGEAPTAERGLDWNLREGMVIVLHPNLFNGEVGVFLGNTYAVGATGPIPITGPRGA